MIEFKELILKASMSRKPGYGYKYCFVLNSTEHEISTAHKK